MVQKINPDQICDLHVFVERGARILAEKGSPSLQIFRQDFIQRTGGKAELCSNAYIVNGTISPDYCDQGTYVGYQSPKENLGHFILRSMPVADAHNAAFTEYTGRNCRQLFQRKTWEIVMCVPISHRSIAMLGQEALQKMLSWIRKTVWETRDKDEQLAAEIYEAWLKKTEDQYAVANYRDREILASELRYAFRRDRQDERAFESLVPLFLLRFERVDRVRDKFGERHEGWTKRR